MCSCDCGEGDGECCEGDPGALTDEDVEVDDECLLCPLQWGVAAVVSTRCMQVGHVGERSNQSSAQRRW